MNKDLQTPFDIAIVMATVVRPTLVQAIRSVYAQRFGGRIQILIGIDRWQGERAMLDALIAECPSHVAVTQLDLGYSTSQRHGGLYPSHYGGALKTLLSYMTTRCSALARLWSTTSRWGRASSSAAAQWSRALPWREKSWSACLRVMRRTCAVSVRRPGKTSGIRPAPARLRRRYAQVPGCAEERRAAAQSATRRISRGSRPRTARGSPRRGRAGVLPA